MGLFDDILEEEGMVEPPPQKQSAIRKGGLFDDILEEEGMLAEEQSVFRQVADIPLGIARGGVTGIKMMTDILGADNPVSKSLAGVEGYMADLMSAQAKEDQQEISRIMKDAEDKGFGEQVKAGIKAFSIAPVDIMSQALGTMAPVVATGLAGGVAKLGALGIRGVQAGVGAGMGAGMIKGEIYNEVKNELINSGTPEEVAEKAAVDAQAYGGKNLDQILLGAGLGAASTLGAEGIITRILTKQGKAATAGIVSRALKGGITEAIPEGIQAAQEQLAKNVALQREGFDVDPSRGIVAAATMEAIAGAPLGGLAGAIEQPVKVKTLEEEKFEQTNEIARKVAESGAPLTASALQDKAAANLNQDELARKLDEELSLTAIKPSAAAPVSVPTKDEYVARYSAIAQTAPEELTRAEQAFTNELATANTEEKRINAQNALDAIKEVKATGITPAAQPTTTDAAKEIIQPEGVRQEPQDGTQVETEEASVSRGLLGATRSEEERQVARDIVSELQAVANNTATREQIARLSMDGLVDVRRGQAIINEDGEGILAQAQAPLPKLTPEERASEVEATPVTTTLAEPTIGEIPQTSPMIGEQPTQPIISEIPTTSELVGAEPATIVEQEQVAPKPLPQEPENYVTVFHATDTQPNIGQRSGYYKGTYTATSKELAKDFGKNLFSTQIDKSKIYKLSNANDSQQLKKDARNAGFNVSEGNGNGETEYLISKGYEGIQRGKEIIILSPQKYKFNSVAEVATPTEPTIKESLPVAQEPPAATKDIFVRLVTNQEKKSEKAKSKGYYTIPDKDGYDVVFKPYGEQGAGYYYTPSKQIEVAKKTSEELSKKEQSDLDWAKGTIAAAEQGVTPAIASLEQAKRIVQKLEPAQEAPAITPAPVAETPAVAPAAEVAPAEEKLFQPDDELVMRSPYTGEDTVVSYRGKPSDGQAVVWTGKMQMQIPESWLREKGTEFTGKEPAGKVAPEIAVEEVVQETPKEEVEKPLPKTKKGLVEELAGEEPKDYALAQDWKKMVAALNKQTKEELAFKVSNNREQDKKFKATQKITSELFPKIKETVDAAGSKWVQSLKTIASENGLEKWTTLEGNSKGEEIYRLANRIASSQINTPAVSETITPAAEPEGISVGNRIQLGKSPQTYIVEEVLPQSESEKANEEQSYSIRNEMTGDVMITGPKGMKQVGGKKARKMAATAKLSDSLDSGEFNAAQALVNQGTTMDRETFIRSITPSATQRATTIHTRLEKDGIISKEEFSNGKGLVYGDGRGAASSYLGSQSYEPFPPAGFTPDYTGDRVAGKGDAIGEKFSTILNTFVLNVVDPQTRSFIVKDIANLLQNGGRAVFVTRGSDVANSKALVSFAPLERIQKSEGKLTYQKGFTQKELIQYLQETLGDGFSIKGLRGGTASDVRVEVIKNTDAELNNPPITQDIRLQAAEVIPNQEVVTPIPEANRYTFEEAVKAVDSHFGKQGIPEGVVIVNNTTDPDLEMKAGYFVNRGQIVINLAYIAKGENLGDIIDHELGHYIFGDPKFKELFKSFWESMTPEEQAEADRLINQFYNKETGAVQMEEKQVRAFLQLIQDSNAMPKWRQLLDSIKRWINEKLGTNFQVTDRNALAVLAAAHKRFKSGEQIIREINSGVLKTAETAQDAEYLAAVERGDMETAQRMVDEAAINAGYNVKAYHGTNAIPFSEFDPNLSGQATSTESDFSFHFTTDRDRASRYGDRVMEVWLDIQTPIDINIKDKEGKPWKKHGLPSPKAGESIDTYYDYNIEKITDMLFFEGQIDIIIRDNNHAHFVVGDNKAIKSADPVTYDDAGNVIPLSQRFRATSPDIRRMAAEPRREQVGGMNIGKAITTPPGITKMTQNVIKAKFFDSSTISDENTGLAFGYIQQLLDKKDNSGNKLAGLVNNIVDDELIAQTQAMVDSGKFTRKEADFEKRMGASLLRVELMNYASRLAAQGDVKMFRLLRKKINNIPSDEYSSGLSADARSLNTAKGYDISGYNTFKIEQESNVDRLAAALFGVSKPNEEQRNIAQQALEDSEDVEYDSAEDIAASIEEIEKRTKRNVVSKIEGQISGNIEGRRRTALERQKERPVTPSSVEKQAQSVIDGLANQLSDTPAFAEKQENLIKAIVQQDLRQKPRMNRKEAWTNQLTAKLIQAGASEAQALTISDLVWRQHEIKAMDRELKELQTAAEKGSLAVIIQRIKDTPLEEQQKPEWMQGVIREYLVEAGLSNKAADTAARLYESVIAERFAEAKQKAFEDTLAKSAPWKNYLSRNAQLGKNALKKIQDAIRTGVLDPTQTTEGIIAKENGWSGFSKEQLTRIVQLDDILSNEENDQITKAEAMSELNKIIVKAKMPVRFRDAISAYYVAQALLGIPTFTVNIYSPTMFAIRNFAIDVAKYAATDPAMIPVAFQSFINSFQNLYDNAMYSFKNQIYMSGEIEYMQGQNVLSELFDKGKAQWAKGDYANGMGNMLVGASQITGRILSALDQGAIEMMQSQNITRYAIEAMSGNKKIPKDKRNEIVNIAISGRRKIKEDLIASGMAPERAGVLADLKVRSELMISLSGFGIKERDVLDAALNDSLQTVGRNRAITINSLKQEQNNLRDSGILSGIPIGFLEGVAQWANKGNQSQQVFAKMLYGFALVPARVFSTSLWFSPIGFVRLGVDSALKKKGMESRYAMSLATEFQQKQRFIEAIAGTIFWVGLGALISSSTDEEDEDKFFKIVVTGNGPDYNTDRQYHDSWHKKYKVHSTHIVIGKTIIPINIGRGGEAISIPLIFLGAGDDSKVKEKLNQARKSPADLETAAEMIGSVFYSFSNRGPFSAFTKPLFDAKKQDKLASELFSQAGYFGKTFIPIVGTSLARNISDFISDPIDKSSVQGAIYSNMPIVGPMIGTKALNAFGQPIRADDWGDRLFKLGAPLAMSFPKNTPENELNELVLKKGDGPPIPTRTNAQKKFEEPLTDKEFELYVREYGRVVSDKMFKNRKRLETMDVKNYTKELDKYVNGYSIDGIEVTGASDMAVRAVKRSRNE